MYSLCKLYKHKPIIINIDMNSNKTVIIVESPAKCKKIESFLGNGYKCIASFGHMRTIDSLKNVDIENNYKPTYTMITKNKQFPKIKKLLSESCDVMLATDDDREGEAIAWHICEIFSLPIKTTKRIIFHEITKTAICNAVKNPTTINLDLVHAQQSRQILDIIVGYKISPILWKNISWNSKKGLSAGRCQTPALRLIYDNQMEINENPGEKSYDTIGYFTSKNIAFNLNNIFKEEKEVELFLELSLQHKHIYSCSKPKKLSKSPPLPLTTSGVQQLANNELRISPKDTMRICQKLYEAGLITYMRTDSKTFSKKFIDSVKEYVNKNWDESYINPNVDRLSIRKTKTTDVTQDAHEAIRPTDINKRTIGAPYHPREQKLYSLIWKISCSACMSNAILNSISAIITAPLDHEYRYTTHIVTFLGWKILDPPSDNNDTYNYCLNISKNREINYNKIQINMGLKKIKLHYTEAKLVNLLEEKGIGRPSTFSSIVEKIQERDYVKLMDVEGKKISCKNYELVEKNISNKIEEKEFGSEKKKLVIQPMGIIVLEFLIKYYDELFSYCYTKKMEDNLDSIANGEMIWHSLCKKCDENIKMVSKNINSFNKNIRIDDNHEYTIGKYGPVIKYTKDGVITFKSVKKNIDLEKLRKNEYNINDIIESDNESKIIGKYKNEDMIIKQGQFGLYAQWGENKKSLKELDKKIEDIILSDVVNFIDKQSNIIRTINDVISIRKGKYGDYIFYKTTVMKKPKFISIKKLKNIKDIANASDNDIINEVNNII